MPFPQPIKIDGRLFYVRADLERSKAEIAGIPPPTPPPIVEFVPAKTAARELGITQLTLKRRTQRSGDQFFAPAKKNPGTVPTASRAEM